MSLPKQKHYELVFLILYAFDMGSSDPDSVVDLLALELKVAKSHVRRALEEAEEVKKELAALDKRLQPISTSFEFSRIQTVERNILRLAAFELLFRKKLPEKVVIAEANRLAKKFATPASLNFVNALLDHLYKELEGKTTSTKEIDASYSALLESERESKLDGDQDQN